MDINGAKVMIDGFNLEGLQGRGIRIYSRHLVEVYKALGSDISVLMSIDAQGIEINTDFLALFKKMNLLNHLKYGLPLLIKTISGGNAGVDLINIPKYDHIPEEFSFINDVSLYVSPGCYWTAKRLRSLGLELTIAPRPKVDIWHTTFWLPLNIKGALRVSTVHDIIPLHDPNISNSYRRKYIKRIRDTLKDARLISCVSQHTMRDLVDYIGIDPQRLFVNYPYASHTDNVIGEDLIHNRLISLDLKYGQYILFVSGIAGNKNVKRLTEAYLSISTDIPLVIVGKKYAGWDAPLAQLVEENKERVRVLDYVSEVDKYILYKAAMFFAFPSLSEGFGAPPIEAMSLGLPVLTSSISCLPEVCSDAALYVDPFDVRDIAEKIGMMINDEELRQRLIALGYERAKFFSKENFVKDLKAAYRRL